MKTTLRLFSLTLMLLVTFLVETSAQMLLTIGNGTNVNTATDYPSPYGNYYWGSREQYLIRASELNAGGFNGGPMTSIAFNVQTPSGVTLNNLSINLGLTSDSELYSFQSGLTNVFTIGGYTDVIGWNTHTFTTPFVWDGTSNLIVEICFNNGNYVYNAVVFQTPTSFQSTANYHNDQSGICAQASSNYFSMRPNMQFGYANPYQNDAGIVELVSPAPMSEPGTYPIITKLKNFGTSPLTSTNINWVVNDVTQTPYTWSGNLATGNVINVTLSTSYTFNQGTNTIKAWTSAPNAVVDSNTFNDFNLTSYNFQPKMSGIYTIGGIGSNFSTFNYAINALQVGVDGPVTFKVADGVYNEQIVLGPVVGVSSLNTITFESTNGNPENCKLQFYSYGNNYTLKFNGGKYYRIKNLTIEAQNDYQGHVIVFENGCDYNVIQGNIIRTSSTSYNTYCIYSNTSNSNYNKIQNNKILNGDQGINWYGTYMYNDFEVGNEFNNNFILDFRSYGIHLVTQDSVSINGNTLISPSNRLSNNVFGIYVYTSNLYKIGNNKVNIQGFSNCEIHGIGYFGGDAAGEGVVFNNTISIENPHYMSKGLYFSQGNAGVFYNSVNLFGNSDSTNYALVNYGEGRVKNNIFSNLSGGYAAEFTYLDSVDYNDYVSVGTRFISVSLINYSSLASLQNSFLGTNLHSLQVNPDFLSPQDLHTYSSLLYHAGTPISGITTDIDNQVRHATTPTIGADEYTLFNNDAGVMSIVAPQNPCAGTFAVTVKVKNYGLVPLSSVAIKWFINGTLNTTTNYTTVIPVGGFADVNVGNMTATSNGVYDMKFFTSNPNGTTDGNIYNDSLIILNAKIKMGGAYTIGASGADYNSIESAISDLENRGICSSTVFNILPGTYYGHFRIHQINGANASNTITFKSSTNNQADVTLYYDNANINEISTFTLDGADFITLASLTIKNTATNSARVIMLINNAQNNSFIGNKIIGSTSSDYNMYGIYAETFSNANNTTIKLNYFVDGTNPIAILGDYYTKIKGVFIDSNYFQNFKGIGIKLENCDSIQIKWNALSSESSYYDFTGIRLNTFGHYNISNNRINLKSLTYSTNFAGINLGQSLNYGGVRDLVSNNFINLSGDNHFIGINSNNNYNTDFVFNTVKINSTNSLSYAFYESSTNSTTSSNTILNNNFYSSGLSIYIEDTVVNYCNYNNYFSTSPYTSIAVIAGTTYPDIASLKAGVPTQNMNSKQVNPIFTGGGDFHVMNPALNAAALSFAGVTNDLDNEPRNATTPDIGADEFAPVAHDISAYSIVSPSSSLELYVSYPVQIRISNIGSNPESNFSVKYIVNDTTIVNYTYTGTLTPGQDTLITFSQSLNFSTLTNTVLKCFTNLASDLNRTNDTVTIGITACGPLSGVYTVGTSAPFFKTINQAISALTNCGIGGPVTLNILPGTYNEKIWISYINGLQDTANFVKIRASNGDANSVVITASSVNQNESQVLLGMSNINNIILENLTFTNNIMLESGSIFIMNNCNNIKVDGCKVNSNNSNQYGIIVEGGNYPCENIFIQNSTVNGGLFGIAAFGNNRNMLIQNNSVNNFDSIGVFIGGSTLVKVIENTISSNKNVFALCGVNFAGVSESPWIFGNKISLSSTKNAFGLLIEGSSGNMNIEKIEAQMPGSTTATYGLVANNFISCKSIGSYVQGLIMVQSEYFDIYYNSINSISAAGGAASYLLDCNELSIFNNSLVSSNNAVAVVLAYNGIINSNNNNIYTPNDTLAIFNGSSISSLSQFKNITGKDQNSVSVNPLYASETDLHSMSNVLNNAGVPTNLVLSDIDHTPRSQTTPDIGADEFIPKFERDLAVLDILKDNPCFGKTNFKALVKNDGLTNITSFSLIWSDEVGFKDTVTYTMTIVPDSTKLIDLTLNYNAQITTQKFKLNVLSVNTLSDMNALNDSLSKIVTFFPTPTVLISGLDTMYCAKNQSYSFQTYPAGGVLIGQGLSGNSFNPSLAGVGQKLIKYTSTNIYGCTNSDSVLIQVNALPTFTYSAIPPFCSGSNGGQISTVNPTGGVFSGNGVTPSGYFSPAITGIGNFPIQYTYTDSNGCSSTQTENAVVLYQPTSSFYAPNAICMGDSLNVNFTGVSDINTSYTWNFDGGIIQTGSGVGPFKITYTTPGLKVLELQTYNGQCSSQVFTRLVYVNPNAATIYTTSGNAYCQGDSLLIVGNQANGNQYDWFKDNVLLPNDTMSFMYAKATGVYKLVVTTSAGCVATSSSLSITEKPMPVSSFTIPSNACSLDTVLITYTGTPLSGANYTWNFDNAQVASGSNEGPYKIIYNSGGNKNLNLKVSLNGCTSPITNNQVAVEHMISNIYLTSSSSFCAGDSVLISGNTIPNATYKWYQNGSEIANATNSYYYAKGTFGYWRKVTSQLGCSMMSTALNVIEKPKPTSTFTAPSMACAGDTVTITYTGTPISGANYIWDFAGATIVSGVNEGPYKIIYNSGGNKNISLSVDASGCNSGITYSALLVNQVMSSIYLTGDSMFCAGDSILLNGVTSGGTIYQWYKDGSMINGTNNNFYFASQTGAFGLKVTNAFGCSVMSNIKNVYQKPMPVSSFTSPTVACSNDTVTVTYIGTPLVGANYIWDFAGATVVSGVNEGPYKLIFNSGGNKNLSLKVSLNGCVSTTSYSNILIHQVLTSAYLTSDSMFCAGDSILLSAISSGGSSYQWYKDGMTISGAISNFYFTNQTGAYKLKVSNTFGCSIYSNILNVYQKIMPTSTFNIASQACSSDTINVTYSGNASSGATYNWDFAGATIISGSNQGPYQIRFTNGGIKNVKLQVSEQGCNSGTTTNQINIFDVFANIYVTNDSTFCDGDSLLLTGSGAPGMIYSWYKNDTLIPSATSSFYYSNTNGSYKLKVLNTFGCSALSNALTVIKKTKPTSNFSLNVASCLEDTIDVVYLGNATSNASYFWNYANANVISGSNQGPIKLKYSNTGQKVISLKVIENGCSSETTVNAITINSTNAVATVVGSTTFCTGDSVSLFANTGPNLSYVWMNGNTELPTETNSYLIAKTTGNYKVKVLNTQTGCKAVSNSIAVTTHSTDFNLAFTANQTTFVNPPFNVNFTNSTPSASNYSFNWSFGDAGVSTAVSPSHQYVWDGSYTVALYAQNLQTGCADTLIKQNYISCSGGNPNPCSIVATINQGGSAVMCQGDSLLLKANITGAQGAVSYTWFRNGVFLSQYSGQQFYAKQNGQYIVVVADTVCNYTSLPLIVGYYPTVNPIIHSYDTIHPCSNDSMQLFVTSFFNSYSWSTGQTTPSIYIKQSGNYFVTVTNSNGCTLVSNPYIVNASLLPAPSICIVGVDTFNHNQVIWERPFSAMIDSFYVYRETTVSNVYQKIGSVAYTNPGIFVDNQANPTVRAWRYRLTALDTCGMESPMSGIHKTMHLTINVGLNGAWNLIWDGYTGFNFGSYNIYRGSSSNNMNILAQVPSNIGSYTDLNPPTGTVYYQIEIVNPYGCYPDSNFAKVNTNYNSSRSNTANTASLIPQYLAADFVANVTQGQWPVQVQFNDLSQGGPNVWKWSFGDGNSSVEENPKHTYNNTGLYTVRLISCFGTVCDTMTKVDYINVLPNGMVEVYDNTRMIVYPNPADNQINIDLISKTGGDYQIRLFDAYGQMLKEEKAKVQIGQSTHNFNIEHLSAGVYFVIVQNENSRIVRKVVVK